MPFSPRIAGSIQYDEMTENWQTRCSHLISPFLLQVLLPQLLQKWRLPSNFPKDYNFARHFGAAGRENCNAGYGFQHLPISRFQPHGMAALFPTRGYKIDPTDRHFCFSGSLSTGFAWLAMIWLYGGALITTPQRSTTHNRATVPANQANSLAGCADRLLIVVLLRSS